MGIPRLSQDLHPYVDNILLGNGELDDSDVQIKSVVIDGPSLVYHVYGQLLAYNCDNGLFTIAKLPSYSQINSGVHQFLTDLKQCGVSIIRIFFDGSLPENKRPVRLERLEKTRQQLETFRRLHITIPTVKSSEDSQDTHAALWHSLVLSSRQHALPPPPFMVAAAIETLLLSEWRDVTRVVDSEADGSCAAVARSNNAAVLSNDSDLVLYDLGINGCVIQFYSLNLRQDQSFQSGRIIKANGLRPLKIARHFGIPDLLRFGFERSKDKSVSTAEISQRSQKAFADATTDELAWSIFRRDFQHVSFEDGAIEHAWGTTLDPRIAEIVSSLIRGDAEVRSYLPVLLEDPVRDSSWSYGKQIRQLGYSILYWSNTVANRSHRNGFVLEYSRRGQRIADEKVSLHSKWNLPSALERFRELMHSSLQEPSNRDNEKLPMRYMLLALHIVLSSKIAADKDYDLAVVRRIFEPNGTDVHYSWPDIHLNSNVQAVIYSIRVLKQLAEFSLSKYDSAATKLRRMLSELVEHLQDMPPLEDVLPDLTQRCRYMSKFTTEERESWFQSLLTSLRSRDLHERAGGAVGSVQTLNTHLLSQNQISSTAWFEQTNSKQSSKRVKTASQGSLDKSKPKSSKKRGSEMRNYNNQNKFDLLKDTN